MDQPVWPPADVTVGWAPQEGPQHALVKCPIFEILYGGARGGGKALTYDSVVWTPFGPKTMADMQVGSQVCCPDGTVARVIGVYPQGVRDVWDVRLDDGAVVRADGDHLWAHRLTGQKLKASRTDIEGNELRWRLATTDQLREKIEAGGKIRIPVTRPVAMTTARRFKGEIDPYALGVLLGDGSIGENAVRLTTVDAEIVTSMTACGLTVEPHNDPISFGVHGITKSMQRLGLSGCRSHEKFIPHEYLYATPERRLALLQGLLDTDGHIDERGHIQFVSTSPRLAEGVQTLVRSLGGKATMTDKIGSYRTSDGDVRECKRVYMLYIRLPVPADGFRLTRKREKFYGKGWNGGHELTRKIVAIEQAGQAETVCIKIDHPAGLFLTDGFVVTHNTDGMLGKFGIKADLYGPSVKALFVRKHQPDLSAAISRAREIYEPLGARWSERKLTLTMPNRAFIRFRHFKYEKDIEQEQGQDYTDVFIEEITQYSDFAPIKKLMASLRSAAGTPAQFHATANPGGPGHLWVKERYIDPHPAGWKVLNETLERTGNTVQRIYIPAKVWDNKILLTQDPTYVDRIAMSGSEALVDAWLDGKWDIIEGAYFDCWSEERHVLRPFAIPMHWVRFRSFDWGSAKPFSCGWWAVAGEDFTTSEGHVIPKGAMVRYRELYGKKGANQGVKWTVEKVAEEICAQEAPDEYVRINYSVADPAIFKESGGPSIAERMARPPNASKAKPLRFEPGDNSRTTEGGSIGGWDMMRQRMIGYGDRPMIYCFSTCVDSVRTIPTLQHDERRPDDVNSEGEDHCFVAGTLVDTNTGPVPIESLTPGKHAVWSAGQWRRNFAPRRTRRDAEVVRLRFSDGQEVVCTPDHRFMDYSGEWRYARDLRNVEVSCDLSLSAAQSRNLTARAITGAARISSGAASAFIERFGRGTTGQSRTGRTSTIRMVTEPTMRQPTWNAFLWRLTWAESMAQKVRSAANARSTRQGAPLRNGMVAMQGVSGTAGITSATSGPSWSSAWRQHAMSAVANILSRSRASSRASSVAVPVRPVRCVSVESAGRADVYCIDEPETRAFTISGGLIVHNCADEWRYACMSRPWTREAPPPPVADRSEEPLGGLSMDQLWAEHSKMARDVERRTRL